MSVTGITMPQGFVAAATTAGLKESGNPDMALVVNQGPTKTAAAVFTRNRVVAAPVNVTRKAIADGTLTAVVYNSGNANACTGTRGRVAAEAVVAATAQALNIPIDQVGMCSTGIIGVQLPQDKAVAGVSDLVTGLGDHGGDAAQAIMTTDTCRKQTHVLGEGYVVGGMAKGVGMMAPSMATMLACLTTDAKIDADVANKLLRRAVCDTFNRLDIDGTTSTNDTVILMASGASGVEPDELSFYRCLLAACEDLAHQLQADAEGVTKRISITVTGARDDREALAAARTIGRDNLFKCAMFGSDPNWGRVMAAVGMAEADMDPNNLSVFFNEYPVCLGSEATHDARDVDLTGEDIDVRVDLGTYGSGTATVHTTDLSHAYVEINSAYTT